MEQSDWAAAAEEDRIERAWTVASNRWLAKAAAQPAAGDRIDPCQM